MIFVQKKKDEKSMRCWCLNRLKLCRRWIGDWLNRNYKPETEILSSRWAGSFGKKFGMFGMFLKNIVCSKVREATETMNRHSQRIIFHIQSSLPVGNCEIKK